MMQQQPGMMQQQPGMMMQQQPGMINQNVMQNTTNVVNNVIVEAPPSVMVFPGVMWSPIGKPCEINNCGSPAYKLCDSPATCGWVPCGKAMCLAHSKVEVRSRKHGGTVMDGYHCVGTPCEGEYIKM